MIGKSAAWLFMLSMLCVALPGNAANLHGDRLSTISLGELPAEARNTLELIRVGGPFPYSKDGVVFANREKILPRQPRGYYHEYTVATPGARSRGAMRIVCAASSPIVCYFSDDHYQSFKQIKQ
jgi:ribonuclease T1